MPEPISLVVFDLGAVLIHWDPRVAVAAGVGASEAERLFAAYDFGAWNHPQDAGRSFEEALAQVEQDSPEWLPHLRAYVDHFPDSLTGPIEGTVRLLEEVAAGPVPVWALTNWAAGTFHHARDRFDFLGLFDRILVSGELGVAKPDPAIYEQLLAEASLPADRVFFTDDKADNVAAARAAGIDAVQFRSPAELREALAARGLVAAAPTPR